MFESVDVLSEAARAHESLGRLAASIGPDMTGPVADELLAELLEIGRQADLAICRAIERADRSGQFAADGAASTHQYVCRKVNERAGWASKRIAAGRALADRLPMTAKSWEAGRLGLDHAHVIDVATRRIEDPKIVAELDRILVLTGVWREHDGVVDRDAVGVASPGPAGDRRRGLVVVVSFCSSGCHGGAHSAVTSATAARALDSSTMFLSPA